MPKRVMLTALGNRIVYATTDGKGLITGKREDITDECIAAVFEHLKNEYDRSNKGDKTFGYRFKGLGEIHYHPPVKEEVKSDSN